MMPYIAVNTKHRIIKFALKARAAHEKEGEKTWSNGRSSARKKAKQKIITNYDLRNLIAKVLRPKRKKINNTQLPRVEEYVEKNSIEKEKLYIMRLHDARTYARFLVQVIHWIRIARRRLCSNFYRGEKITMHVLVAIFELSREFI